MIVETYKIVRLVVFDVQPVVKVNKHDRLARALGPPFCPARL
jgi:hypothetical protein